MKIIESFEFFEKENPEVFEKVDRGLAKVIFTAGWILKEMNCSCKHKGGQNRSNEIRKAAGE